MKINNYEFAFNFVNAVNGLGNAPQFELYDYLDDDLFCLRTKVGDCSIRLDIDSNGGTLTVRNVEGKLSAELVAVAVSFGFSVGTNRVVYISDESDLVLARRFDRIVKVIHAFV